jgi:hypothetical protein
VRVNRAQPPTTPGDCGPDGTRLRGANLAEIESGASGSPFRGARTSAGSGRRTRRHCGSRLVPWRGSPIGNRRGSPPALHTAGGPRSPPEGGAHTPGVHPPAFPSKQDSEQAVSEPKAPLGRGAGSPSWGGHRLGMPWYIRGDGHGSLRCVHSRSVSRAMKCTAAGPPGESHGAATGRRAVAEHHFLGSPTPGGCACARRHRR